MTVLAPLEVEREVSGRMIRVGDVVRIVGLGRARVDVGTRTRPEFVPGFRVLGFRGDDVEVFGAKCGGRAPAVRTFTIDRIRT